MTEASEKLREGMKNPKERLISLHREYGLDQREFSKILIITFTALLFVSIQVTGTLDSVQNDLQETDDQVQQASAVISSDSFQQAINTLQRVQSQSVTNQIETAQNAFQSFPPFRSLIKYKKILCYFSVICQNSGLPVDY